MRDIDRYRGCLLGGAAGDALGYAVEFTGESDIFRLYGSAGITDYDLQAGGGKGLISDDTQMTLFTAAGLLKALERERDLDGRVDFRRGISRSYLDWYRTQTRPYTADPAETPYTRLAETAGLYHRRAPGATCLSACRAGAEGTLEEPVNDSCGCGGVMRVAPVGLFFDAEDGNPWQYGCREIQRLGAGAAALTHGHEMGWLPAAVMAHMVSRLAHDPSATVLTAARDAMALLPEVFPQAEQTADLLALLERAISLAQSGTDSLDAVHRLGEGWVGHEALAIALYCALKYEDDFDRALTVSVNHRGDSDSTGSITGNILGAKIGLSGIPEKYRKNLELSDTVLGVADALYEKSVN